MCEEEKVEQARRVEVAEVRLGEAAKGARVRRVVAGQLERVAVGLALPAPRDCCQCRQREERERKPE